MSLDHSTAPARTEVLGPLRLHLDENRSVQRSVDGAWWPHSRDIVAETTQLVLGAEHLIGQIDRVTVHNGDWPERPRRFVLGDRVVRLGYFTSSPSLVNLVPRHGPQIVLLLIPPTATEADAARAIARAVDSTDRSRAADMLAGTP